MVGGLTAFWFVAYVAVSMIDVKCPESDCHFVGIGYAAPRVIDFLDGGCSCNAVAVET